MKKFYKIAFALLLITFAGNLPVFSSWYSGPTGSSVQSSIPGGSGGTVNNQGGGGGSQSGSSQGSNGQGVGYGQGGSGQSSGVLASIKAAFSKCVSVVKAVVSTVANTISRIASAIATGISKACQTVANTAKTFIAKVCGDPVLLTSGRYTQNDIDIALKTFSGSVNISRYYISGHGTAGKQLGSEWVLSTEERLVRGYTEGADSAALEMDTAVSSLSSAVENAEEEWKNRNQYAPDAEFESEFEEELAEGRRELEAGKSAAANYRAIADKAKNLKVLNRYVSYGAVSANQGT
ncbi:MAG: hypothetical protein J6X56_11360, partial [Ruminococcus sp.]|nr:hypothetical protein [Ruminococcus sp.]